MYAVILAAWTLWIWSPGVRHPDSGAWLQEPTAEMRPTPIPKEYLDEGHCRSALLARKTQGYLRSDVYGECLPSGVNPFTGEMPDKK